MFLFLTYFTLYSRLQYHPLYLNWSKCILFNSWVIFHCVYVQLSYLFICQWTVTVLLCPSYCKQCCDEHWGTSVSFNSGFLGIPGSYSNSISSFLRNLHTVHSWVCIPTNSVRGFLFSASSPAFIVCRLFDSNHSDQCEMVPHCDFFSLNRRCRS